MSMSSKTTPFSLELFSFFKQLAWLEAGLIEENLDLGPTTYRKKTRKTLSWNYCLQKYSFRGLRVFSNTFTVIMLQMFKYYTPLQLLSYLPAAF